MSPTKSYETLRIETTTSTHSVNSKGGIDPPRSFSSTPTARPHKVAEVRNTAPKYAVQRVLDERKHTKEKLCQELEERRAARRR